ncbi:mucin-2-like [Amphibalanus amphitrite]|uniref:mucin-2-like n=1 Tax=Amphibalanus amphitrite TaxID=1232801 RepID=UPI001C902535|nr:mucin-2-like [Amphibalanus amphitrite]
MSAPRPTVDSERAETGKFGRSIARRNAVKRCPLRQRAAPARSADSSRVTWHGSEAGAPPPAGRLRDRHSSYVSDSDDDAFDDAEAALLNHYLASSRGSAAAEVSRRPVSTLGHVQKSPARTSAVPPGKVQKVLISERNPENTSATDQGQCPSETTDHSTRGGDWTTDDTTAAPCSGLTGSVPHVVPVGLSTATGTDPPRFTPSGSSAATGTNPPRSAPFGLPADTTAETELDPPRAAPSGSAYGAFTAPPRDTPSVSASGTFTAHSRPALAAVSEKVITETYVGNGITYTKQTSVTCYLTCETAPEEGSGPQGPARKCHSLPAARGGR